MWQASEANSSGLPKREGKGIEAAKECCTASGSVFMSGVALNGTKEVGTWNVDGTKSGGTIHWTTGWTYVGDWWVTDGYAELPHGRGVMTSPDGKVEDGLWQRGNFVGPKP